MTNHHELENTSELPYRNGVGMMIINSQKQIFVGKRVESRFEAWQMPQGGILLGETPSKAAFREMKEELGCNDSKILSETKKWYSYNIPDFLISKLWDGRYKGQKQKWFLMQFTGSDADINVHTENAEFREWRWVDPSELLEIIVPFKKRLYSAVLNEFLPLIQSS